MDLKRHGNSNWSADLLIIQTLLWRMSPESNVTDAHDDSQKNCDQLFGASATRSYQALMNILLVYTPQLMDKLQKHLRGKMHADPNSRIAGYFALAVDGSKPSAPRTESNEKRFISRGYGNGKNAKYGQKRSGKMKKKGKGKKKTSLSQKPKINQPIPNVLITKFWNVALQLPWHWTVGGAETDERREAGEVAETLEFPEQSLIIADAGFVGYELWQKFLEANLTFLIRAGSNVYLKPKDSRAGLYYYRPNRYKNQRPILVRLVNIKIGKTKMAMLTNELEPTQLSKQLIRTFYELRWGVEVDFRDFKQTFNCKKFRCKTAERVIVEATWSMLAFTLIKWWSHRHVSTQHDDHPRVSFTLAVKAFRRALNNHNNIDRPEKTLHQELKQAVIDSYRRRASKDARYKPVGEKPKTGLPIIQTITAKQKKDLEDALQLAT